MKQIGLALNYYVAAKKTFPPGETIFRPQATLYTWSWAYLVLPFMEQQGIYDRRSRAPNGTKAYLLADPMNELQNSSPSSPQRESHSERQ